MQREGEERSEGINLVQALKSLSQQTRPITQNIALAMVFICLTLFSFHDSFAFLSVPLYLSICSFPFNLYTLSAIISTVHRIFAQSRVVPA